MKRVFTRSDFKKYCKICGRNGHEEEFCAASPVTFIWKYGGQKVELCGSFSQWQVKKLMHRDNENEPFKLHMSLTPGVYQYKFIVDGVWRWDMYEKTVDDGVGGKSNVIEVEPANFDSDEEEDNEDYFVIISDPIKGNTNNKIITINYPFPASWVAIKGSWDHWKDQIALKRFKQNNDHNFYVALKIAPGNYQFKFIVDGNWVTNPAYPTIKSKDDNINNLLSIPSNFTLTTQKPINFEKKPYLVWQIQESKWEHGGSIHHTLQGHSMNVICETVYIIGGLANAKFTNTIYVYNSQTQEFSIIEDQSGDIPEPRAFHHTMVFGTKILVYGGFNQRYLTDYYLFNTVNHIWTKCEVEGEGPGPRERSTCVPYIEDKLIHFGGYYCSPDMEVETYFNDVHVLSLGQMEWFKPEVKKSEGAEFPLPRYGHTSNVIKKRMYVFGGVTKNQKNLNDMWVLEPGSDVDFEWRKIETKGIAPEPRHGHSAVTTNTNIVYLAGRGNGLKFYDNLFLFDTLTYTWVYPLVEGTKPPPRYYHRSISMAEGNELIVFGGVRPKEFSHYPRIFTLKSNVELHVVQEVEEEEKS